jgi:hypothetical protein
MPRHDLGGGLAPLQLSGREERVQRLGLFRSHVATEKLFILLDPLRERSFA